MLLTLCRRAPTAHQKAFIFKTRLNRVGFVNVAYPLRALFVSGIGQLNLKSKDAFLG